VRIGKPGTHLGTEGFQSPFVAVLIMAENVRVSVICVDAEVQSIRSIPLVFNRFNEMSRIPEPELNWPLIGFMAGITFNPKLHTA